MKSSAFGSGGQGRRRAYRSFVSTAPSVFAGTENVADRSAKRNVSSMATTADNVTGINAVHNISVFGMIPMRNLSSNANATHKSIAASKVPVNGAKSHAATNHTGNGTKWTGQNSSLPIVNLNRTANPTSGTPVSVITPEFLNNLNNNINLMRLMNDPRVGPAPAPVPPQIIKYTTEYRNDYGSEGISRTTIITIIAVVIILIAIAVRVIRLLTSGQDPNKIMVHPYPVAFAPSNSGPSSHPTMSVIYTISAVHTTPPGSDEPPTYEEVVKIVPAKPTLSSIPLPGPTVTGS
ncbi:hypothetical protein BV898_08278 [Hypsibius exemplaris]|uniref:Uncharacterized protein n=1 Tax=Hypsibius exemplaris TaxID=2072580 RepID=A0A1W0WR19_HYPEX|nr:hypothetical protein BV898_08278 [Hypsibius exemplaris]